MSFCARQLRWEQIEGAWRSCEKADAATAARVLSDLVHRLAPAYLFTGERRGSVGAVWRGNYSVAGYGRIPSESGFARILPRMRKQGQNSLSAHACGQSFQCLCGRVGKGETPTSGNSKGLSIQKAVPSVGIREKKVVEDSNKEVICEILKFL